MTKKIILIPAIILFLLLSIQQAAYAQFFKDSTFTQQFSQFILTQTKKSQTKPCLDSFFTYWNANLSQNHQLFLNIFNLLYTQNFNINSYCTFLQDINQLLNAGKDNIAINWTNFLYKKLSHRKYSTFLNWISYLHKFLYDSILTNNSILSLKFRGDYNFSFKNASITVNATSAGDLFVFYAGDTICIHNTIGSFDSKKSVWSGQNGTIYWDKFPKIGKSAYASITGKYSINTKKKNFAIKNVLFSFDYNRFTFKNLPGKLICRFSASPMEQKKNPVFISYKQLNKKNIFKQTDFKGKIKVAGQYISGQGQMLFYLGDSVVISAKSNDFKFLPGLLKGYDTEMKIFYGKNKLMIYHPDVLMSLIYDTTLIYRFYPYLVNATFCMDLPRLLSFARSTDGRSAQPFFDFYHRIKIYDSEIIWLFSKKLYIYKTFRTANEQPHFQSFYYYAPDLMKNYYSPQGANFLALFYQFWINNHRPDTVYLKPFLAFLHLQHVRATVRDVENLFENMDQDGYALYHYSTNYDSVYAYNITHFLELAVKARNRKFFVKDPKKLQKYSVDFDNIDIHLENTQHSDTLQRMLSAFLIEKHALNATINLKNKQLDIFYPKRLPLSLARFVFVKTDTLKIGKNLNMKFSGKLSVGMIDFYGKNFSFNYKKFQISVHNAKKMKMKFYKKVDSIPIGIAISPKGDTSYVYRYKFQLQNLKSSISFITGKVIIDKPNNKSGLLAKQDDNYPIFIATSKSKIYYPKAPVDSAGFYFQNYPFTLKNLDFLTEKNMTMLGRFHSTILRDIDSLHLTVQADNSLGFIKRDTVNGFKIFGKARLLGYLILDYSGLHSSGMLKFLSTVVKGTFQLKPKELTGISDSLLVKPVDKITQKRLHYKGQFPNLLFTGKGNIDLVNKKDSTQVMYVDYISGKNVQLYPNFLKGVYSGTLKKAHLAIKYTGVVAKGTMNFADALIKSDSFNLYYDYFIADTSSFQLKDSTYTNTLFNANNVYCFMDLHSKIGTFLANDVNNYVIFPKNKYIVYSDHFEWKINQGLIDIGGSLSNPKYLVVSSQQQRDSLLQTGKYDKRLIRLSGTKLVSMKKHNPVNFESAKTVYYPKNQIITAYDVPQLLIADSKILPAYPVRIKIGGIIDTIRHARMIIGKFKKNISDATVFIQNSKFYSASGIYTYPDTQHIFFQILQPKIKDTITIGYANLKKGQKIYLNNYFIFDHADFAHDITLEGDKKFLHFDGLVYIQNQCDTMKPRGFIVHAYVNPDSVYLPVDFPISGKYHDLYASPIIHKIDAYRYKFYNSFLSPPINPVTDSVLYHVKGYITYSPQKAYYLIGSKPKILNPDTILPMIAYDYRRCLLFADGNVHYGINYGPHFNVKMYGKYRAILGTNKNELTNVILVINFPFLNKVFSYITKDLNNNEKIQYIDYQNDLPLQNAILIAAKTKKEKSDFLENEKLPQNLKGTIVLGDVNLIWDPNRSSFRTIKGKSKVALLYLNNKEQDVYTNAWIEMRYSRAGISRMFIVLQVAPGQWYFFKYVLDGRNGFMRIASYNHKPEKDISLLKRKQRELAKHYQIGTAELTDLHRFMILYGKKL